MDKKADGSLQLYRKCNSKETWVFLGWFKDDETVPYNFADPIEGDFTLTAHWRLDGGYTIQYTPEYWLETASGDAALINGQLRDWVDPTSESETLSYTDGATTTIFKAPTGLTMNGTVVPDDSLVFRGWRIVSVSTSTDDNGQTINTYTPLEDDVYYDPGDDFNVDVQYADTNNIIHMQAVYEETEGSVRRPEIANLTLDANSGYLVDNDGNQLTTDKNLDWGGVGTILMDADNDQILFGDIQSSKAAHLNKYATEEADTHLPDGYFKHPAGSLLLGFDDEANEGDYVATYPADSVISVKRKDQETIYAVWEPLVYMTFVNDTDDNNKAVGPVTFGLSPTNDADAETLTVVNVKDGTYERKPLSDYNSITLQAGKSITLAFPKGAEKSITISGTNQLGAGSILYWQGELNGDKSGHASGNCDNGEDFTFAETLVVDETGVVVTFTSDQHDRTLVFDDNYEGGGTQEDYFTEEQFNNLTASATMPSTNTRFGYELKGWATTAERANNGVIDYATGYVMEGAELVDFFGDDIIKTLYAVWEAKNIANTVYVYKTVPTPGSQTKEFTYQLSISGKFRNTETGGSNNLSAGSENAFTLTSGQHAKIYIKESLGGRNEKAYLKATVDIYDVGVDDTETGATALSTYTYTAEASANGGGSFDGTEKLYVEENSSDHYTPSVEVAASTKTGTVNDLTSSDNRVSWTKPSAGGTVIYTNTLDTYDITVDKTTFVDNSAVNTQFAFNASYVLENKTTNLGTFYVTSGTPNTTALKDIPATSRLTITEIDTEESYDTTVKLDSADPEDSKSITFDVTKDHTVYYVNTLKTYDVKFVKTDQAGTAGVVEAKFKLDASNHNIGTNLLASDAAGSDGVFYSSTTTGYEPLHAGETYTLTETYTEEGYIGLKTPVTITVSGNSDPTKRFTFKDSAGNKINDVTATLVNDEWVIQVKNQETKKITIRKTFEDPLYSQRTFKFSYSYTFDNKTIGDKFTKVVPTGSTVSEILTVPVGATNLTVTELTTDSGDDHYAWVATQYDTTVQKNGDASAVVSPSYTIGSVSDDATITFTNKRKTLQVTVIKKVEGVDGTFDFTALLQNGDIGIRGYTLNSDKNIKTGVSDEDAGQASFRLTTSNGTAKLEYLTVPYGAHLTITETKAEGYSTGYEVTEDGGTTTTGENLTTGQLTITKPTTITFTNSEVIVAPTGYVSRQMPYICMGLLAMLLLAIMVLGRRQRRWAADGMDSDEFD